MFRHVCMCACEYHCISLYTTVYHACLHLLGSEEIKELRQAIASSFLEMKTAAVKEASLQENLNVL